MKELNCCFTGHRLVPAEVEPYLRRALEDTIRQLAAEGKISFLCGGARGFDTLAALTVLEIKKELPHLRLELILPCADQTKGWSEREIALFQRIRESADRVEVLREEYVAGCMHERNRAMVDRSSVCVAYLTRATGGTRYTVDYARKKGLRLLIYSPTGGEQ